MRLFLSDLCCFLERGQGVFLLLKGSLGVTHCRFLFPEGHVPLCEGRVERGDGRLLALELGLLALKLGLLLLERRPSSLKLGSLHPDLLGSPLRRSSLGIVLVGGLRQLLLQRMLACPRVGHQGVGLDRSNDQLGIVLSKPTHLGVQPGQLGAFVARFPSAAASGGT